MCGGLLHAPTACRRTGMMGLFVPYPNLPMTADHHLRMPHRRTFASFPSFLPALRVYAVASTWKQLGVTAPAY